MAKIADLGVAKVIVPQHAGQALSRVPGTPVFMPPEALLTNPKYGTSLDIFSLGCVCIHLVSLELPVPEALQQLDDETGKMIVTQLSEFQRREKFLENFKYLPALKDWTEECLKDSPKDRPAIGEVVERLKNIRYDPAPHENDDILQLYTSLVDREEQLDQKEEEVANCKEQIEELDKQSKNLNQELTRVSQQLTETSQQLATRTQQLQNTENMLLETDTLLANSEALLTEKDQELAQCKQQITDKGQELTDKSKQFNQELAKIAAEKDQQLAVKSEHYEKKLQEKDLQLAQCMQQLREKDEELTRVKNALSEKEKNKVWYSYNYIVSYI